MPKRLIGTSLVLVFIGMLPFILSFFKIQLQWPAQLPEFIPMPIRQWLVDYGSFQLIWIVGVGLLALAVILVARMLWEEHFRTEPMGMSDVLLQEVEAIHGSKPDDSLAKDFEDFLAGSQEQRSREDVERTGGEQAEGHDKLSNVSPRLFQWLNGVDPRGRTALCLSGGGIRSASFALGVLQALAAHPRQTGSEGTVSSPQKSLLAQFNYLSTVSGGGYIGSWFSAWVQRVGYSNVWRALVRGDHEQDPGEQATPIKWLRVHGNYLTPKLGLSGDTLADVAIFLRNLLLNWLVLLPVLCAVLILMKLMALEVFGLWMKPGGWGYWGPFILWLILLVSAHSFTLRNRPTRTYGEENQASETAFLTWGLTPSILAAIAFTLFLALAILHLSEPWYSALKAPNLANFVAAAFSGAVLYALSYAVSWIRSWPKALARGWAKLRLFFDKDGRVTVGEMTAGNFWRWTLSGALYGTLVMTIGWLFLNNDAPIEKWIFLDYFNPRPSDSTTAPRRLLALVYLGVPLMLGAQLIAEMIFVGLTSEEANSDEDREWLGRAAGLLLLAGVGWLAVMHLAYISTDIAIRAGKFFSEHPWESATGLALLFIIGAVAASIGRSSRTPAQTGPDMGAKAKTASATLSIVAAVLVVVLVVGVSALIDYLVLGDSIAEYAPTSGDARVKFLLAFAVVLFVGLISSTSINVNRFSMHALYRNRLIRTFLGASNPGRRPNPFTDFAREDNPAMHTLWPSQHTWDGSKVGEAGGERSWRPFHVVNIALNVTSSQKHLEWQERKAASFTVSPLHCGSGITGFRSSREYGGYDEKDLKHSGISLGTAMAVSGAAASPNQGYNSSPSVAFLMALFNVRLGWWLGNPGRKGDVTYKYDGPGNAVVPFMAEMLGLTSDTNKYVYLSDGGHFDNLGLYEMVRRRCRFIVAVDAGCDPEFAFEDLGNAVRKIEIDLGVPIRFSGLDRLKSRHSQYGLGDAKAFLHDLQDRIRNLEPERNRPDDSQASPYHAMGVVDYPAADGQKRPDGRDIEKGIILYIKPGYHGTEASAGIRSYAISNPSFPHDDTANQWFGESQMESYRALGFEITDGLLRKAQELKGEPDLMLDDVLKVLARHSYGVAHAGRAPQ
jgi:predicted acylesterase/phospholipase RssA